MAAARSHTNSGAGTPTAVGVRATKLVYEAPRRQRASSQAVVSPGSDPSGRGALETTTRPGGSGTGVAPKLVMLVQPPGRLNCTTSSGVPVAHSSASAVR